MVAVVMKVKTYAVVADFHQAAAILPAAVAAKESHYRLLLRTRIQEHAQGRPGPEQVTGEYVASIGIRGPAVGTDDPQGRRLEFGYHGPDSSGRHFHQPPRPHFGPAVDEVRPLFFAALGRLVVEALP
jgi:hypothetical protein